MPLIRDTIDMLGRRAKDKVTGFDGTITCVSFDLPGCVQVVVTPDAKDHKIEDGRWFDVNRVELAVQDRVMPVPDFEAGYRKPEDYDRGPADKPRK